MAVTLPKDEKVQKGYLIDVRNPVDRLEFQYNPIKITDTKNIKMASTGIPGASHPVVTPTHGGDRTIKFDLDFFSDLNPEFIMLKLSWLKSVEHPYPNQSPSVYTYGMPVVMFIFGKLYKLPVYLSKLKIVLSERFQPDLYPIYAKVSVDLTEVVDKTIISNQVKYWDYGDRSGFQRSIRTTGGRLL